MHATKLLLCLLLSITAVHAEPSNSTLALNATANEPEPPADAIAPMRSVWMEKADSFVDSIVGQGMLLAGDAKEAANLRMEQGMALASDAKERLDVLVRDEIAPMLSVWMEKADSFVDSIVGQGMLLAGDAKEAANLRMEQGMALASDAKERLDVLVRDEIAPMRSVWMEKADSFVDSIVGQGMLLAGDAKEAANLRMEQGMALASDAKERIDVLVRDEIAPMRSVWMEKADSFVDSIVGQGMLLAGDAKEAANLRTEQGMALALDAKERLDVLVRDEITPMLSVWMEKADSFVDSIVGQGMLLAGDAKEAANLRTEQGMALALDAKERLDVLVNDEPRLIGTVLTFVLVMIAIRLFLRRPITEGTKNAPSSNSVRSSVQAKENMQTSDDASDDASDDGSEATREGTPLQTRTDALFDMLSAVSTPDEMGELRRKREAIERTLTPKELFADQVEEDSGAGRAEKVPIEDEMDPLHRSIDDIVQSLTSLLAGE